MGNISFNLLIENVNVSARPSVFCYSHGCTSADWNEWMKNCKLYTQTQTQSINSYQFIIKELFSFISLCLSLFFFFCERCPSERKNSLKFLRSRFSQFILFCFHSFHSSIATKRRQLKHQIDRFDSLNNSF